MRALTCLIVLVFSVAPLRAENTALLGLAGENEAQVWQAIGRLDADGTGFCTATLIDPDTVLTAAHCVFTPDATLLDARSLTFRAGLRNGKSAAERKVVQIVTDPGYHPGPVFDAENIRHDVALLRLAEPIPTHVLDPFVVEDGPARPGPVSVVSYGLGREDIPSRQKVCQMLGAHDDVLMMDCEVTFGSSGAPVFSHDNGRGRIVSLVSGMSVAGGRRLTFGMALPQVVRDLRQQLRARATGPVAQVRRITVGGGSVTETGAKFVRP